MTAVASSRRRSSTVAAALRRDATSSTTAPATCARRCATALPDGADVVVDPVGGDLAEPALRALRWGGRFVTVGYASGTIPRIPLNLVLLKGIHDRRLPVARLLHAPARRDGPQRGASCSSCSPPGRAVPHIGAPFPLDDAAAALRYVADGRAIGKVVARRPRAVTEAPHDRIASTPSTWPPTPSACSKG